jgi:subtilisin family serine protease
MSLGTPAINSYEDDPICNAVRKLVDAGVVVVAAAGNNGKDAMDKKSTAPFTARQRAFGDHSRRQQQLRHRSAQRRRSHELQLAWSNAQLSVDSTV